MIRKRNLFVGLLLFWMYGSSFAQATKKEASAIIAYDRSSFEMTSQKNGVFKVQTQIIVLNSKGKDVAQFELHTNSFEELTRFTAVVSSNGKEHRFGLKDVAKSDYSDNLMTDSKTHRFTPPLPSPYVVTYEYEVTYKNGFCIFPVYVPLNSYFTELRKSETEIIVPKGTEIDWLGLNIGEPQITAMEKTTVYKWRVDSLEPMKPEQYALPFRMRVPIVYAKPRNFYYGGYGGSHEEWKDLGAWHAKLNEGRDKLPESTVAKIKELTAGATSDYEKVRILYDYLAVSTRYVSIQLGIGGYQTQPAATVDKTKFGDCKGLSNYLSAMLKELGIPSYYTIISTRERKLPRDFASSALMNHVILKVELPERDLWLECTNAFIPFGYVHSDIAGHDALVLKKEGGVLETLPDYPDSLNKTSEQVQLTVAENGEVNASSLLGVYLDRAESFFDFDKLEQSEKNKAIAEMLNFSVSEARITSVEYNKSELPSVKIGYQVKSGTYAKFSANRLFVPVDGFSKLSGMERNMDRKAPIYVRKGYMISDTIRITVPDKYVPESFPADVSIREKYGSCSLRLLKEADHSVTVKLSFVLYTGEYPKEEYEAFSNFLKAAGKCYAEQLVFVKK